MVNLDFRDLGDTIVVQSQGSLTDLRRKRDPSEATVPETSRITTSDMVVSLQQGRNVIARLTVSASIRQFITKS